MTFKLCGILRSSETRLTFSGSLWLRVRGPLKDKGGESRDITVGFLDCGNGEANIDQMANMFDAIYSTCRVC